MSSAVYKVYVDWDLDDFGSAYANISSDVIEIPQIMRGKDEQLGHAQAGICEIRLGDIEHKYSPENSLSVLYGSLLPYRPIRVTGTFGGTEYDLFNGFISKIVPHPHWAKQDCYIYAVDGMDWLTKGVTGTPVFLNVEEEYTNWTGETVSVYGANWYGQSFTVEKAGYKVGIGLPIVKKGTPGIITGGLKATDVDGKPTGDYLTSNTFVNDNIPAQPTPWTELTWIDLMFPYIEPTVGNKYAIVLHNTAGALADRIVWPRGGPGEVVTALGSNDSGATWTEGDYDMLFKIYYVPL